MNTLTTFKTNVGLITGQYLYTRFTDSCKNNNTTNSRDYHIGLKSILNPELQDTVFTDGILTKAEGLSPRLLLMR